MNQALIQLPLPILLPKLDVTLAWEYFPLRGNTGPGIPGTLLPLLIPTLEPALAAFTWLQAQPSGPPLQEPGVRRIQTLLPAVCPGGLAPLQLTGT